MTIAVDRPAAEHVAPRGRRAGSPYPFWFYLPAAVIYGVLFSRRPSPRSISA
jgi:raffinose/stachyose/melibiose transport system permease protein